MAQHSVRNFADYLTVGEAAKVLGVSPWTLRNWDQSGKLKASRHPISGHRIYCRNELESLLNSNGGAEPRASSLTPGLQWGEIGPAEHIVQFYESDRFLVESVTDYVARGLEGGDGILIIATQEHRRRIRRKLKRRGLDLPAARKQGQCVVLDAEKTLSEFMSDEGPDLTRFQAAFGNVLADLTGRWPRVRAFGEMVSVLWTTGSQATALRIEKLWNDLAKQHSVLVLCSYPLNGFQDATNGASLAEICGCHSRVIPAESYSSLATPAEQLRTIALLQQKAARLEVEISDRRQVDRDRAMLAAIIESSDDAIVSKTLDGIIRTWNGGAERLFGYTESEIVGKPITTIIPPERLDEEAEILGRLRRGERIEHYETVRVAKDGRRLDISLTISPLRDSEGELIGASKIARDITERKRAEEALRTSEDRYRRLAELLPIGVYACRAPSGEITYFNKQAAELWGRAPQIGDTDERFCGSSRIFRPDGSYLPHDKCPMALALCEGRSFRNQEAILERADGSRITALVNIDPVRDLNGRVVGAVNVFQDMSAMKAAERAVREQKENLQTLLETLPLAVLIAEDARCRRIMGNRAATELLRLPRDANLSKTAPPQEKPVHFRILKDGKEIPDDSLPMQRAARGEVVRGEEMHLEFDDGVTRHALVFARALYDPDGRPRGAVAGMLDITELKNAEIALKEADRRKDEFLATLAHELRNPLAPISNGLQVLRMAGQNGSPTDPLREIHEMMERQVAHMVRLIDDLLEFSRISRGKIKLKREPVELQAVVGHAVETSRPIIDAAGHSLEVRLPKDPVVVRGDMVRLAQVFSNLLNNAAKYTHTGGAIALTVRREEDQAVVSVRDTGIGIPREMLSRVFELFAQIDNPLRRSQDGLGIGLSLVQSLVAMHEGTVEARSEGLGHGSEFVVRLPASDTDSSIAQSTAAPNERSVSERAGQRILVVDDNRDAADSLGRMLKCLGGDVQIVYDGPSALEAIKICRPSILFLDLGMPGMNGYDVARKIRLEPENKDLVLVALTGWGQEEDRRRSREAGIDHHLVKPVDLDLLQAILVKYEGKGASQGGPASKLLD